MFKEYFFNRAKIIFWQNSYQNSHLSSIPDFSNVSMPHQIELYQTPNVSQYFLLKYDLFNNHM